MWTKFFDFELPFLSACHCWLFFFLQPDSMDWEDQLKNIKEEKDDEFAIVEKPGVRWDILEVLIMLW